MLYYIESEAGEFHIPFMSEDAYEGAIDWYNATSKADHIKFCNHRGFDLCASPRQLLSDWANLSMMVYAWQDQMPEAAAMLEGVFAAARKVEQ